MSGRVKVGSEIAGLKTIDYGKAMDWCLLMVTVESAFIFTSVMTSAGSGLSGVTVLRIWVVTGGGDWHLDKLPPAMPETENCNKKIYKSFKLAYKIKKKKITKY